MGFPLGLGWVSVYFGLISIYFSSILCLEYNDVVMDHDSEVL